MRVAIDYINNIGLENIKIYENTLYKYMASKLCNIDGILIKKAFKTFNLTEIERKLNEAGRLFQLENNITLQIS